MLDPTVPKELRRERAYVPFLVGALVTIGAACAVAPDLFEVDLRTPFAQLAAFRPQVLVLLLAAVAAGLPFVRSRPALRPAVAGLGVVLLAGVLTVVPRAVPDPAPSTVGRPLTVIAFNALEGTADVRALADLIRERRPDVVALSEAGPRFRARLDPLVAPLGYRVGGSTGRDGLEILGVSVVVTDRVGDVRVNVGSGTAIAPVEVSGGRLGAVRVVAFHTMAPLPGLLPQWRADLAHLSQWCAGPGPVIVAGDLNATLDQSPLRTGMAGCSDVAAMRGRGLTPTWGPDDVLRSVGPQIDHVLVRDGTQARSFDVVALPGSDHRAVVADLLVP